MSPSIRIIADLCQIMGGIPRRDKAQGATLGDRSCNDNLDAAIVRPEGR